LHQAAKALRSSSWRGPRSRRGGAQLLQAPGHHAAEVHTLGVEAAVRQGRRGEPAALHQRLQRHHQRAAGKGAHALVGRIAGADGRGGQPLPDGLAAGLQPVDEVVGLGAEVADAVRAGQGGDVQQHAAGALVEVHVVVSGVWRSTTRACAGMIKWVCAAWPAASMPALSRPRSSGLPAG
jgi:hypothetical protein